MNIIQQVGLIIGLCWVSQCIENILPFSFPASVIALALLLLFLLLRALRVEQVRDTSDFLLSNLPFFFVPITVGIINYWDLILPHLAALVVICLVSMVATFAATAWTVQFTMRWMERRRNK